jgi:hypothetical protein
VPWRDLEIPQRRESPHSAALWTVGPAGDVALVHSRQQVRVLRWDASGELVYDRDFPRAASGAEVDRELPVRLGAPLHAALTPDGSLALGAWSLAEDCEHDRRPGFVVLDPEGRIQADVPLEHHIERFVIGPDHELVARGAIYDLEGTELARFDLPPEHWRRAQEERRERAASVGPHSTPFEWVEAYHAVDPGRQHQIGEWLIAGWPEAEPFLIDSIWLELGERICDAHPDRARDAALRRFETSRGEDKIEWLRVLPACWEAAPPGALDYVRELAKHRSSHWSSVVHLAFNAWGLPQDFVDELWLAALDGRTEGDYHLLQFLDQTVDRLDELVRSRSPVHLEIARRILLPSIQGWARPERLRGRAANARTLLVFRARAWVLDESPDVAATGRLLLIGHGAEPAAALLQPALADAERDPSLLPWLAAALVHGQSKKQLALAPRDQVYRLVERGLEPPADPRAPRRHPTGPGDPFQALLEALGAGGHDLVWRQALSTGAADGSSRPYRVRLLDLMARNPDLWPRERLRLVLDQPWLVDGLLPGSAALLHAVALELEGHDPGLAALAQERFRELFVFLSGERVRWMGLQRLGGTGTSPLWRALTPDDVAPLVEREGIGRTLWLVAEAGATSSQAAAIEPLLADRRTALEAARALSALRHPAALDVLVERGLRGSAPPVEAFVRYGDEAHDRLVPLLDHEDPEVRRSVVRVLRALDPTPELVARVRDEAAAAYARGELPEVDALLLLEHAGPGALRELLLAIAGIEHSWSDLQQHRSYVNRPDLVHALGRHAERDRDPRTRGAAVTLLRGAWEQGNRAARPWLRRLGEWR